MRDYPKRWPNFFTDLLQTLSLGPQAVDLYIRVLLAIDSEVVDREIVHSKEEADRNTHIKDHMRETCVEALVDSWYHILVNTIISSLFHQIIFFLLLDII